MAWASGEVGTPSLARNWLIVYIGNFVGSIGTFDPAFAAGTGMDLRSLTWLSFLWRNLVPVTAGNIIGGGFLVAAVYWFVFLRHRDRPIPVGRRGSADSGRPRNHPGVIAV